MSQLPSRPDLEQARRQAKELLRAARAGDGEAAARIVAVSDRQTLAGAQLALAREHGFPSWSRLKREIERRQILDDRDTDRLAALLAEEPELATTPLRRWRDHRGGPSPLSYTAMLRYDTTGGVWRDLPDTGPVARLLLEAGAPVDGKPGDKETPLMTAASYGAAEVAKALIEAGADLEARAADDAGGVPDGTALLHAAVFGMTDVVDVLAAAGAQAHGIEEAAAAGDVGDWLDEAPADARLRALVLASDHQRLDVIDRLIAAGTPVDATDPVFGGQPLRTAAWNGRSASVRRLLDHGADPDLRDDEGRTPLDLCRLGDTAGHREVEAILTSRESPAARDAD